METSTALRARRRLRARALVFLLVALTVTAVPRAARAGITYGEMVRYDLVFPVAGDHYFTDTFGAYRSHGKGHQGQDILAAKGTPVVAAATGVVRYVNWTQRSHLNPTRCCSVVIKHDDGWETRYLHLNNDTPGTDDGKGWGIADGIVPGARVHAGQLIGWVGDSGNAEDTPSHLHFELIDPDGVHANSFESLLLAGGNPPPRGWSAGEDTLLSSSGILRRGDRGDAVQRLQEVLEGLGYTVGPIDGVFGPMTAAAVLAFQQDHGLAVDGLVGRRTLGAIPDAPAEPTVVGLGSRGAGVREAQELLAALGFDPGPLDGIFGPQTLEAVLGFQRARGLQVDGLVGPQTRSRLGIR